MASYQMQSYDSADLLAPATGMERLAAAACHGALVFGLPFVLPLLVYFIWPIVQPSSYVKSQALQALLFHAFFLLVTTATGYVVLATFFYSLVSVFVHPLLLGVPAAVLIAIVGGVICLWSVVVMFLATLRALQGRPYRVPVVGSFVR